MGEGGKKGGLFRAVKDFVYGVAAHDSARFALKTRASMEHLFILITMGDMLGVPIYRPITLWAAAVRRPPDSHVEEKYAQGKRPDGRAGITYSTVERPGSRASLSIIAARGPSDKEVHYFARKNL